MIRSAFLLVATVIGLFCSAPAPAGAQEPRVPIALSIDVCLAGIDAREVARIVEIEIDSPLVPIHEADELTTRITASCADAMVVVRVEDPLTAKILERRVSLAGEDERGRPRLLALAMVELMAASWAELASSRSDAREASGALEDVDALRAAAIDLVRSRHAARGESLELSAGAEAHARVLLSGPWVLGGGGFRLGLHPTRWLAIRGGFLAEAGIAELSSGRVVLESYGGTLAVELTARLDASFELGGGIAGHAAHGLLRGEPADERSLGGRIEGLFASASVLGVARYVGLAPFVAELRLELGHSVTRLLGVVGTQLAVELGGPWASLGLVVGARG